jgi:hypothetical protein
MSKRVKHWRIKMYVGNISWVWVGHMLRGGYVAYDTRAEAAAFAALLKEKTKLVRIVAKPKPPAEDKLEKVIAELRDNYEYNRKRLAKERAANSPPEITRFWEGCQTESAIAIKTAQRFL